MLEETTGARLDQVEAQQESFKRDVDKWAVQVMQRLNASERTWAAELNIGSASERLDN